MKTQAQHRLAVFMTLSLSIHLFWFIGNPSHSINSPRQDSRQLAVRISESGATNDSQKKSRSPEKPPVTNKSAPAIKQQAKHTHDRQDPQQTSAEFDQRARARILGHVRQRLVQHFVYPRLARRQGWQGRVMLAFQVDRAGAIQRVHIKQSSGYAVLDDSAVSAMNKLGVIGIQEKAFFNRIWQLEIPIIYRLEG